MSLRGWLRLNMRDGESLQRHQPTYWEFGEMVAQQRSCSWNKFKLNGNKLCWTQKYGFLEQKNAQRMLSLQLLSLLNLICILHCSSLKKQQNCQTCPLAWRSVPQSANYTWDFHWLHLLVLCVMCVKKGRKISIVQLIWGSQAIRYDWCHSMPSVTA